MGAKAQSGLRRLSEPWLYATWPTGCTAGPSLPLCWLHRSPAISDPKSLTEALNQLRPCPTLWVGAGDGVPSPADPEHLPSRTGTHAHLFWGGGAMWQREDRAQDGAGSITARETEAAHPHSTDDTLQISEGYLQEVGPSYSPCLNLVSSSLGFLTILGRPLPPRSALQRKDCSRVLMGSSSSSETRSNLTLPLRR